MGRAAVVRIAVVRIEPGPAVWHELPAALAAEIGWTIASFGHLEDMLKRVIFALDRHRLPGAIRESEYRGWLKRMDHVAADSMGTLIERLDQTLAREGLADPDLIGQLDEVKTWRNLLCHAAWQPGDEGWEPRFANTKGEVFKGTLDAADVEAIREMTLDSARRVLRILRRLDDHGNGWME